MGGGVYAQNRPTGDVRNRFGGANPRGGFMPMMRTIPMKRGYGGGVWQESPAGGMGGMGGVWQNRNDGGMGRMSEMLMERMAQENLEMKMRNAALKKDLDFFQSRGGGGGGRVWKDEDSGMGGGRGDMFSSERGGSGGMFSNSVGRSMFSGGSSMGSGYNMMDYGRRISGYDPSPPKMMRRY